MSSDLEKQKLGLLIKMCLVAIKPDMEKLVASNKPLDGKTPVKGEDYFTEGDIAELKASILAQLPTPKDGVDAVVDYEKLFTFLQEEVAKLPKAKDGQDAVVDYARIVTDVLSQIPPAQVPEISYIDIKEYIDKELEKIKKNNPAQVHSFSGGAAQYLSQMLDVDLSGLTKNANGQYILNTGGSSTLTWSYLATTWSVEPSFNEAITGGDVYNYTLDGTTRYRFVPTVYDATEDAFYTTFSAGVLTGLIVTRG